MRQDTTRLLAKIITGFILFGGASTFLASRLDSGLTRNQAGTAETRLAVPVDLRCEYLEDPMGIDVRTPRFFWTVDHPERGEKQTAYSLTVSTDPRFESDTVWDSGRVQSSRSIHISYAGRPLLSGRTYYWKVKIWDGEGRESAWSKTARFDTGLFEAAEWQASWITGGNELRKEFNVPSNPKRARAYISGLGYYELRINGLKVGDHVLDPAWTTYEKHVLYATYDITGHVREGANALAVNLGQGWFKSRILICRVEIELADGTRMAVTTDSSWKTSDGPVVADSIYDGETYDARLETNGWDRPGFDDSNWRQAEAVKGPAGVLSAQMMPPIKVVDTVVPFKMTNPKPGVYVFDMGQNLSGWALLKVSGPRGTEIRLRFAELLYEDGMLNRENLRSARVEDRYILKGEGQEIWEPRFTYHGFRYVELTGFPGTPRLDTIRGRVVHTAANPIGSFSASNDILNELQRIITWGQKTNLHGIPTDCNQRDERMGWMGDAQVTGGEAIMNFDLAAFYTNFIRDIRDVQDEKGQITDTVPHVWGSRPADPAWGTAYPLLCWYMYLYYDDTRILEENYEGLKKYVRFLAGRAENGLVKFSHYGDWVAIDKCPGAIVSSFYYYYDTKILSDIAGILGRKEDAAVYGRLAEEIRAAFHREYYDPETGDYAGGSQTANTLALFLDLVPAPERGRVRGRLFDDIIYEHDSHLTTGIIGTKYVMEVLTRYGASDLAYDIAVKTTYPGWGYMIENGATTLWELWQKREGSSMNSHNHPMFGSLGSWLYKALAGINIAPGTAGFEKVIIQPAVVRDLGYVSASFRTVRGDVGCVWSRGDNRLSLEVIVPFGSEAEIVIPRLNLRNVKVSEGDNAVWKDGKFAPGVSGILNAGEKGGVIRITAGGGRYAFLIEGD